VRFRCSYRPKPFDVRHPFCYPNKDNELRQQLREKLLSSLRILNAGISIACSDRIFGALTTEWRALALKEVTWTGIRWKEIGDKLEATSKGSGKTYRRRPDCNRRTP
jgi:hypothetical protein